MSQVSRRNFIIAGTVGTLGLGTGIWYWTRKP
ncbi:MAG: hypothetical protein DRR19_32485 [Candidatus Parabeggiatoa sp. nov. 1]|nr:MAG: hypothetical protein DRR19_32485 [Gammaproteobacteria bacterium]